MVSTGGNRDLVSAIGNDGGARVMSTTNFNQPQGNPETGEFSNKSSKCLYVEQPSDVGNADLPSGSPVYVGCAD